MTRKKPEFPYAQLFEAIPIGLYRRTPEGKLIDVNPALVQASGWPSREALLAVDVASLYADPEDPPRMRERMQHDGVVRNFEIRLLRHHEPPIWVEINAVAVRDEAGNVSCYEGTIASIAARKEMELELRRSEQRLRAIMNALDEIVAIVDREQRFVAVMGHGLQDMGFVPDSVIGKTVREVFGKDNAHIHEAAGARALRGERVVYEWQTDLLATPLWFQISLFPLRELTGEVNGLVATAYDMTHLKQTQDKLANTLAEKDALLKEVHHRVKNNLQIISSLLNLQFDRVSDSGLREMVMESQQRIHAMALVHEQVYRSETLMRLDTRVFLNSLVSSLIRSYATSSQHVDAIVEADETTLDLDVAIPIALVINEARVQLAQARLRHTGARSAASRHAAAYGGRKTAPRRARQRRRHAAGFRHHQGPHARPVARHQPGTADRRPGDDPRHRRHGGHRIHNRLLNEPARSGNGVGSDLPARWPGPQNGVGSDLPAPPAWRAAPEITPDPISGSAGCDTETGVIPRRHPAWEHAALRRYWAIITPGLLLSDAREKAEAHAGSRTFPGVTSCLRQHVSSSSKTSGSLPETCSDASKTPAIA